MEKLKDITDEEKLLSLLFLERLMEGCYIDKLTGSFFCKKCKCPVSIDWGHHIAFCVKASKLCICVTKEDVEKELRTGKKALALEILEIRYAKGEVTEQQFKQMKENIKK